MTGIGDIDSELGRLEEDDSDSSFKIDDYVIFPACPDTLFKIVGGNAPFWKLDHAAGPDLPPNYHKTFFEANPPERPSVIETIIEVVNPLTVLAFMADEDEPA